ncbi:Gpi16 subunit, GPI transamidase component [Macrolepiota fuliginosa MF-IS2]|uniref:Gpi16 subunit, GPI transamidase component n=1 Tax=Macrolepiota fuliginosa MF-IS2 TaxID=1400762 RepID=A0A9P5XD44_9AGAR|nr:Gpi16 subunit, GPI transamidase component [Macrolepiota fuliginosa MF-IS2]
MKLALRWLLVFSSTCNLVYGLTTEIFDENLKINHLQDGRVSTTFTFETVLKGASPRDPRTLNTQDASQHYVLFPLTLGQILREYAVTELHLTLNAGNWNYDRWGYPEEKGVGTGAELWAWMGTGAPTSVDDRWKGLRNALAGLFCASLGSLDEQRTTSPTRSYFPQGVLPNWNGNSTHQLRHASLPSEHVCTENLTPFLKLLPCKSLSGVASLLNPHRLFDADWHGMSVHVLWLGAAGIKVRLTFQSLMDPLRSSISNNQNWSFQSLFDHTIERNCPAANSSTVQVTLPSSDSYSAVPEPPVVSGSLATYDVLTAQKPLDISVSRRGEFQYPSSFQAVAPISVTRTLQGFNQANGRLSLVLRNHRSVPQSLVYLETMPWLVQFHLHTLQARVEGRIHDDVISDISYTAAVPHSRPTTFQAMLRLPPNSVTRLNMDVDKAFLRYTEHPPDAQRGWDLPPAVLTPLILDTNGTHLSDEYRLGEPIYTSTLLVDVATPDFSMPYNVIIFTCSLVAFIFGSIFNLLTRKFVVLHLDSNQGN